MAVETGLKHAGFIARSIDMARLFKQAYDSWVALRAEYDSSDYGAQITDADFLVVSREKNYAANWMTAADLQAFYTSEANLVAYWDAGNGTNISKLFP